MSSKEDYLDNLLQTVNASSASGSGTALQKLAGIHEDDAEQGTLSESQGNVSFSDDEDIDEELEFPELAELFGDLPAQKAEPEKTDAAQAEKENMSEQEQTIENTSVSEQIEADAAKTEPEQTEAVTAQAEPDMPEQVENIMAETESAGATETVTAMPLKDIEDMDLAELEAMMSGASMDAAYTSQQAPVQPEMDTYSETEKQDAEIQTAAEDDIQGGMIATQEMTQTAAMAESADDADVEKLLDSMSEDSDLAEIGELLRRSDNHEPIPDDMADIVAALDNGEDPAGAEEEAKGRKKARKGLFGRKKKKQKEQDIEEQLLQEVSESPADKKAGKKTGFFGRIFAFLTEDDDLSELDAELAQLDLSKENIAILEAVDKESGNGKKSKKDKKEKKLKKEKEKKEKAEKKPKKEKKEKKQKKPKKEKPIKPIEPEVPLKPIGKRKIVTGFLFGITVFGMIYLFTSYIPDIVDRQSSRLAYKDKDYQKVYDLLVTKELKGSEEKRFKGAVLCLQMERKLESYENYKKLEGMELEQLHALISGVGKYQRIENEAEQYGVLDSLHNIYLNILGILQDEYGVSEAEAQRIAAETNETEYTKELMRIAGMEIPTAEDLKR